MNNLETATNSELIAELSKRADSGVIILQYDKTQKQRPVLVSYFGVLSTCSGLLTYAHQQVRQEMRDALRNE